VRHEILSTASRKLISLKKTFFVISRNQEEFLEFFDEVD